MFKASGRVNENPSRLDQAGGTRVMGFASWSIFVLTHAAMAGSPGPAAILVVSRAVVRGAVSSLPANLGVVSGVGAYLVLSAAGLTALVLASPSLFRALQWAGALYLLWLGIRTFRSPADEEHLEAADRPNAAQDAGAGFLLLVSNPQALVYFVAILPQFIDPARAVSAQFALLGVTAVTVEFLVLAGYAVLADQAARTMGRHWFRARANRLAGLLLAGLGIGMLVLRGTT